jgi:hypothetical protein
VTDVGGTEADDGDGDEPSKPVESPKKGWRDYLQDNATVVLSLVLAGVFLLAVFRTAGGDPNTALGIINAAGPANVAFGIALQIAPVVLAFALAVYAGAVVLAAIEGDESSLKAWILIGLAVAIGMAFIPLRTALPGALSLVGVMVFIGWDTRREKKKAAESGEAGAGQDDGDAEQREEGSEQGDAKNAESKERSGFQKGYWYVGVIALLICLGALNSIGSIWLPPQIVTPKTGRAFTAYVLASDSDSLTLLLDSPRQIERVKRSDLKQWQICERSTDRPMFFSVDGPAGPKYEPCPTRAASVTN